MNAPVLGACESETYLNVSVVMIFNFSGEFTKCCVIVTDRDEDRNGVEICFSVAARCRQSNGVLKIITKLV